MAVQKSKTQHVITKRRVGAAALLSGVVAGIAMAWPIGGPSLDSQVPNQVYSWNWG